MAAAAPQVIIDTGEAKKGAKEDLDALQEQLGIPVVFIEAKLSDYGAAYERLGEMLGVQERGAELAGRCAEPALAGRGRCRRRGGPLKKVQEAVECSGKPVAQNIIFTDRSHSTVPFQPFSRLRFFEREQL